MAYQTPLRKPKSRTNTGAMATAPRSSTRNTVFRINSVIRTIPPTWGAEMESRMVLRCIRLIFRPEKIATATETVTTPMPSDLDQKQDHRLSEHGPVGGCVMGHQSGHTYRRGGCKESVQKGRALSVPGGQGQRQTKAAQKDHQHKAQDDHLERGNVSVYLSLNFALISHLRFCHIFRTCL